MSAKLTIIGAGPGGYVAALRAAQLGADVTIIERDNVGGTCLNWGCIPSKIMKTTADKLEDLHRAAEFGIRTGEAAVDMTGLMARKNAIVNDHIKELEHLFLKNKISYIKGNAFIKGNGKVEVKLNEGGTCEVDYDKLLLALGTRPFEIPGLPFDGKKIISSNEALNLEELPESMMIVGGGVIGCEFAFIFSTLGVEVTLVEGLSRLLPLPSVDPDCSKILQREMKKRKLKFMCDRTVESFVEEAGKLKVTVGPSPFSDNPKKKPQAPVEVVVDKVLVCVGRSPLSRSVGLDNIGVETDERGWIKADDFFRTSNENVFAIGDILGPSRVMLAHAASHEGIAAVENALAGGEKTINYNHIPGAIFTMPEIANVGLTEEQAVERGINARSDSVLFRNIGKAQAIGEVNGQAKIISNADTGEVLGLHIAGPHATDLISEGTLALTMGCTVNELAHTIHAHPTLAEVVMETAFKALNQPVHG